MAYLTPNEGMAAAYATLAFFFVVATGVVSLPQFRHFLSSFDLLLVTVAAALRENTSSRASVAASSLPPVAPRVIRSRRTARSSHGPHDCDWRDARQRLRTSRARRRM